MLTWRLPTLRMPTSAATDSARTASLLIASVLGASDAAKSLSLKGISAVIIEVHHSSVHKDELCGLAGVKNADCAWRELATPERKFFERV
jgi:hypothetical protein